MQAVSGLNWIAVEISRDPTVGLRVQQTAPLRSRLSNTFRAATARERYVRTDYEEEEA
jgi:hypothetical protein